MTQIDIKMSKHNWHACYASSVSLAAAHKKAIDRASASMAEKSAVAEKKEAQPNSNFMRFLGGSKKGVASNGLK